MRRLDLGFAGGAVGWNCYDRFISPSLSDLNMKIALVTDAWFPQVNGVVTTWSNVREQLSGLGHTFEVFHPGLFKTFTAPKYPEIKLAILPGRKLRRLVESFEPDAVHVATEGPVGFAGRNWAVSTGTPFTTSYHTQFPQYLNTYFGAPTSPTWAFMRWFHGKAHRTLVPTRSIAEELAEHAFAAERLVVWTRGVQHDVFHPYPDDHTTLAELPRPRFVYVGRVAPEKNIEAFLGLDLPGVKVVIGDGPARQGLEQKYPDVHFAGFRKGEQLARHIAACDVFVFPSLTDTFGVVMIEALACGLPVAAYPVTGPRDVITRPEAGVLDDDLAAACRGALKLDREPCVAFARSFTWRRCAQMVLDNLAPLPRPAAAAG